MNWHDVRLRLSALIRPKRTESDLEQELSLHIAMDTEKNIAKGMTSEEARRQALVKFGAVSQVTEECRDARGISLISSIVQDVRYAVRTLLKNPGFTAAAVLTLALGIGANTAIYSVIDGVLLHPVPFADADRLVALYQKKGSEEKNSVSYLNLLDWQRQNETFEAIAGMRTDGFTLTGRGQAEQLFGMMVSADFFPLLRVQPLLGRLFTPEEDRRGVGGVVLLGEDFWKAHFAGDPTVIGQSLNLNGRIFTIIGVVPANVRFQRASNTLFNDVFTPLGQFDDPSFYLRGLGNGTSGLGRLKAGVTLKQAQSDMARVMKNLAATYPSEDARTEANVLSLAQDVAGDLQTLLLVLGSAVGFVLLIAATNVANLTLARSTGRFSEFGVRLSLGASRGRLMRQLFTESAVLAIAGGVIGTVFAALGTHAALQMLPSALPAISHVELNGRVLAFSFAITLLSGLLFGAAPAFKAGRMNLQSAVKQGGRGSVRSRYSAERALIVMEIALTLVLLVGAGLMMRSLFKLWNVNPGFNADGVLVFYTGVSPERAGSPANARTAMREINDRLSGLPDVESASLEIGGLPLLGLTTVSFLSEDDPDIQDGTGEYRIGRFYAVGPDHFKTMGIPLRGRSFSRLDTDKTPLVVVVDEELARTVFPGVDPIGKHIRMGLLDSRPAEIIGIAGHVKHSGLDSDPTDKVRSQIYTPYMQLPDTLTALAANGLAGIVRYKANPAAVLISIRRELGLFDSGRAIHSEQMMTDVVAASLASRRFSLTIVGAFAATALLLSLIGIYGVVSYIVGQRTNEIGLRMALGARPRAIFYDVLSEGWKLGGVGVLIGLIGSAALNRLLGSLLFGISPTDVGTFVGAVVLLLGFTMLACYIPAQRALRIEPMAALRSE